MQHDIEYVLRMEPGVQTPEETLTRARGSCRDSALLLAQIARHLGLAARFVSGYLIQLTSDVKPVDGPAGPKSDFTDLHAWTEVYVPGAGWIGLDPTSGLLAGEGHLPLACTADPANAAPIAGGVDECAVEFSYDMRVERIGEQRRSTKPYRDDEWAAIDAVGALVDARLVAGDVRLTMGGEPTFVSLDNPDGVMDRAHSTPDPGSAGTLGRSYRPAAAAFDELLARLVLLEREGETTLGRRSRLDRQAELQERVEEGTLG